MLKKLGINMESKNAKLKRMVKEALKYQTSLYEELSVYKDNPQVDRQALIAEVKAGILDDVLKAIDGNFLYLGILSNGREL